MKTWKRMLAVSVAFAMTVTSMPTSSFVWAAEDTVSDAAVETSGEEAMEVAAEAALSPEMLTEDADQEAEEAEVDEEEDADILLEEPGGEEPSSETTEEAAAEEDEILITEDDVWESSDEVMELAEGETAERGSEANPIPLTLGEKVSEADSALEVEETKYYSFTVTEKKNYCFYILDAGETTIARSTLYSSTEDGLSEISSWRENGWGYSTMLSLEEGSYVLERTAESDTTETEGYQLLVCAQPVITGLKIENAPQTFLTIDNLSEMNELVLTATLDNDWTASLFHFINWDTEEDDRTYYDHVIFNDDAHKVEMRLYDANQKQIPFYDDTDEYASQLAAGSYKLVFSVPDTEITYTYNFDVVMPKGQELTPGNAYNVHLDADQNAYFTFTPAETGWYDFYSEGGYSTSVHMYGEDGRAIGEGCYSGGAGENFYLKYELQAGKTYLFGVSYSSYDYDDDKKIPSADFTIQFKKSSGIEKVTLNTTLKSDTIVKGIESAAQLMDADQSTVTITYADGNTLDLSVDDNYVDGYSARLLVAPLKADGSLMETSYEKSSIN